MRYDDRRTRHTVMPARQSCREAGPITQAGGGWVGGRVNMRPCVCPCPCVCVYGSTQANTGGAGGCSDFSAEREPTSVGHALPCARTCSATAAVVAAAARHGEPNAGGQQRHGSIGSSRSSLASRRCGLQRPGLRGAALLVVCGDRCSGRALWLPQCPFAACLVLRSGLWCFLYEFKPSMNPRLRTPA